MLSIAKWKNSIPIYREDDSSHSHDCQNDQAIFSNSSHNCKNQLLDHEDYKTTRASQSYGSLGSGTV